MPGILIALGLLAALTAICSSLLHYNWWLRTQYGTYLSNIKPEMEYSLVQDALAASETSCDGPQCILFSSSATKLLRVERILGAAEVVPCPTSAEWSGERLRPGIQHPALCRVPLHILGDTHIHGNIQAPLITVAAQTPVWLVSDGYLATEQLISSAQELTLLSAGSLTITSLETASAARITLISATGEIRLGEMTGASILTAQAAERIHVPPGVVVQPLEDNSQLLLPGLVLDVLQD